MNVDLNICVNLLGTKNVIIREIAQICILECAMKDVVYTRGVKRDRKREKEFGMQEL